MRVLKNKKTGKFFRITGNDCECLAQATRFSDKTHYMAVKYAKQGYMIIVVSK